MKYEERIIKTSILAGFTDILIGLFMFFTGWHQWYFDHFHFFGVLGLGMLCYGFWHWFLYNKDTGRGFKWLMKF